jgi:Spy/CpxP family protein refolding chaperone
MNPMKYLVAVLGMAAAAALAQPPDAPPGPPPGGPPHGPPHGGPGFAGPGNIDRLAILLDLDPYQKNEVQRVLMEKRAAMRTERQQQHASGQRPTFEEMRAKRQQNEDAIVAQLSTVLSDTQITKLKILLEEPRGGGPGPRGGPPGGAPAGPPSDVPAAK